MPLMIMWHRAVRLAGLGATRFTMDLVKYLEGTKRSAPWVKKGYGENSDVFQGEASASGMRNFAIVLRRMNSQRLQNQISK